MDDDVMTMIEVKTSELIGPALDWAVAKAEKGYEIDMSFIHVDDGKAPFYCFSPSTRWDQGGPLIDAHQIEFSICDTTDIVGASMFCWKSYGKSHRTRWSKGETHLVSACRAIVAAKLGDVVSVPAELVHGVQL